MNYQLIIGNKEQTNISQDAKKWFYEKVLKGKPGPFTCVTVDNKTRAILLIKPNHGQQMELF